MPKRTTIELDEERLGSRQERGGSRGGPCGRTPLAGARGRPVRLSGGPAGTALLSPIGEGLRPPRIRARALALQRDLAHHHGMWHRTPIPDLLIAETALFHSLGVVHVDRDFERIAEVRDLAVRRVG